MPRQRKKLPPQGLRLAVRIEPEMLDRLHAAQKRLQNRVPGVSVSLSDTVRQLLGDALKSEEAVLTQS